MLKNVPEMAAMPLANETAATPPSSEEMRRSSTVLVGFEKRT